MKKTLLTAVICAMTASSPLFGQTQSLSFSPTGPLTIDITNTNTFTLSLYLTFGGYSAIDITYWLETDIPSPFLSITGVSYFTFTHPHQLAPNPAIFSSMSGSMPGFMSEARDLGATRTAYIRDPVPGGTYHVTDLTFMLAPGTPLGMYSLCSTKLPPRVSIVTDTDLNDYNIPASCIMLNIVPEPSTLSLLGLAAISSALLVYRRQKGQIK